MNFTSMEFLLFFPVVVLVHWLLPHRLRWLWLLCASGYFYLWWDVRAGLLLGVTIAASWLGARAAASSADAKGRRAGLLIGAGVPLLVLLIFKYAGFFAGAGAGLLRLTGMPVADPAWHLLLPVGISFYTFQTMSYVVDVYRGDIRPEPHPGYYALYVCFFPQLVAGPIERPGRLIPQLRARRACRREALYQGLWLMLRGFTKKVVIADYLAALVDPVYGTPGEANGPAILWATVCFALQIYCDFSGYSDIALGAARMLGIELMVNFDRPYRAKSIREFWRRWHISLTGWFRDYLYKPLGGSKKGLPRLCLNLMLVFLVSGLWHGASLTFVLWGALHGVYMMADRLGDHFKFHPLRRLPGRLGSVLSTGFTFLLVCFAWILFRADSLSSAGLLMMGLFRGWSVLPGLLTGTARTAFAGLLLRLFCLGLLDELPGELPVPSDPHSSGSDALTLLFLILLVIFGWLSLAASGGSNAFIYFQF